ncbi:MAG: Zn-dependent hydrolase, partial [Deltaproteobacteria bacterium CG11_big_fil_rev_8_21_14_0_20_49_13]
MIKWFSHASFLFEGSKIIYTDPWELKRSELKADMVLITHDHFDHCAPGDVERVSKPSTVVVAPADCIKKLEVGGLKLEMRAVKPGETVTVADVKIEAVPAYNVNKQFHPKVNNWVGYIFTLDGERIYQAGDTDAVPEMNDIKADMVILPVGGTYTMTAEEAAGVVNKINPKLAIPMHFGKIVGSEEDAEKFKKLAMCEV